MKDKIRKPNFNGMFYPDSKEKLHSIICKLLDHSNKIDIPKDRLKGIIVPHAGYSFSGKTAAKGFIQIEKIKDIKNVIILGPNHSVYTDRAVEDENDYWMTPLGKVKIKKTELFDKDSNIHKGEHSIEVQIPFLQETIKDDFTITPIIIGDINENEAENIAEKIIDILNNDTLLVISTDLSHFLSENEANEIDNITLERLISLKDSGLDACGRNPLVVLQKICEKKKWEIHLIDYSTSANSTKDKSKVVGYASLWFG